jgi:hypothetical protein
MKAEDMNETKASARVGMRGIIVGFRFVGYS